VFIAWKGDHGPRHVHVYKDAKLVVKWDLDANVAMKGRPTAQVVALIEKLKREDLL
jgi:hypothetical protein